MIRETITNSNNSYYHLIFVLCMYSYLGTLLYNRKTIKSNELLGNLFISVIFMPVLVPMYTYLFLVLFIKTILLLFIVCISCVLILIFGLIYPNEVKQLKELNQNIYKKLVNFYSF